MATFDERFALPTQLPELADNRLFNDYQVIPGTSVGNKLFGTGGEERFQTWPERMLRSGLALPADVYSGREPIIDESGHTAQPVIERAQDLAGLAGMSTLGIKPGTASVGSGMVRTGNEDLAYLLKGKSEIDTIGKEAGNIKNDGISVLKLENAPEGYDANRLIYKKDGKIVGAMQVTKISNSDIYKVANTYVDPNYRRQGIATELNNKGKELFGKLESSELEASPAGQAFREAVFREDTKAGTGIAAVNQRTGPFYSTLENTIAGSKVQKATPEQWTSYLKNQPGVKPEELEFSLQGLGNGPISKDQLLAHAQENGIKLGEVWKGGVEKSTDAIDKEIRSISNWPNDPSKAKNPQDQLRLDELNKKWEDLQTIPTKYSSYQLPGGSDYRELLMTLPDTSGATKNSIAKEIGYSKPYDDLSFRDQNIVDNFYFERIKDNKIPEYRSSHWDEPNVLAHIRMNDRDIPGVGKTLHVEEIQSDFMQAHRKEVGKIKEAVNKDFDSIADRMVQAGVIKKICD